MDDTTDSATPNKSSLARARAALSGMRARRRLKDVPEVKRREHLDRSLDLGLSAAPSIKDRDISLFSRGLDPMFAGINTFLKSPYVENIREIGQYDVAVVGAPFDMGTTYRSGARFGPQAVRRISALYDQYSPDLGMDLLEEITIGDAGDIFVIPANIEKTFDQIDLGLSHILDAGAFPIVIGGDHCIGFPDAKRSRNTLRASWASSISIAISTLPKRRWMSGCTPPTGPMRQTFPTFLQPIWYKSASAAGSEITRV